MNTQFSQTAVLISQHIYNAVRRSVIPGGNLDSASAAGRMDNLSVSNVHGHMVDCASAVCIENQIARPHLGRLIGVPCLACSLEVLGRVIPATWL